MFTYLGHIFAFLAAVLVLAVIVYTRDKGKRHTFVYFFDVLEPHESFTPEDWAIISSYLQSKDCPTGSPDVFNGHDITDCDAKCKAELRSMSTKLSADDLRQLGLSEHVSFTYCAWRYADPDHPDRIDPVTGEVERIVFKGFKICGL